MRLRTTFLIAIGLGMVVGGPSAAEAQQTSDPTGSPVSQPAEQGRPPQAYGAGITVYSIAATAMVPLKSDTTYDFIPGNLHRFRTGGSIWFQAPVVIPVGSLLEYFALDACDTNAGAQISAVLHQCPVGGGTCNSIAGVVTGITPGCGQFVEPSIPAVVAGSTYTISVAVGGTDSTTSFGGVHIGWKRQVSPAPGTATFSDVPVGHPLHRFVEALVASGITGGCGGGNYCPDTALTRGQMAVFLAFALGLHWPN